MHISHSALQAALANPAPPPLKIGPARVLLVDDDHIFRAILSKLLQFKGFIVVEAADVSTALKFIGSESFDALLSDMHMPAPGDGLTVISAMRHSQPRAITILLSAFPEMGEATKAILGQVDEILVKTVGFDALLAILDERLKSGAAPRRVIESVASILERETMSTIEDWLNCVDIDPLVTMVPLDDDVRCAYLPQLFKDLIYRLRNPLPLGRRTMSSPAAARHGLDRRRQGYSAPMLVEESRCLQNSIFQTLQNNLHKVDFSELLTSIMAIADEVDSQLAQQMVSYIEELKIDLVEA